MLKLYSSMMGASGTLLRSLLHRRCRAGKEDPARLDERMGIPGRPRPAGPLVWIHAASVGEAQSALILVSAVMARVPAVHVLLTTGTVSSAALMEKRLPPGAVHQYYPLDHPRWIARFLDHWRPDAALWMESEIWPNMIEGLRTRGIPAAMVNARLSPRSFRRWKLAAGDIARLLSAFSVILPQTQEDADSFTALGAAAVIVSDNLKYAATPLPCDEEELKKLRAATAGRPLWLYASTHEGEEAIACRIHRHLEKTVPGLLTILAPRHPERRAAIVKTCEKHGITPALRGDRRTAPAPSDSLYIADTMGELGLFYRLAPLACIGRSFSNDGGGGHNPVEAARLGCAILHGPHIQNLAAIYAELNKEGAAISLKSEQDFQKRLERLLTDSDGLDSLREKATEFAAQKTAVLQTVMTALAPVLTHLEPKTGRKCA